LGGEEPAAAADGGASDGAVIAKGSFDVAVPAVAAGTGFLLLAGAAFVVVVLRSRRKATGADSPVAWTLE
jgi:hypothetical protein